MSFPLEQSISNIWNASIEEELDGFYVVKNLGWNQDIAAGASVSFGMTVYEAFTGFPEYYTMIGKEITLATDAYSVDYVITEDWGDGYKAEVTITNNKTTALEDWRLGFDYDDNTITQIWNGVILSEENGYYEIGCETYNQNIAPMASVTFGFMVEPGCSGNLMEDISLKEYETDISDGKALVMGYFEEETMELSLSMYSSVTVTSYHIFVSYDGNDFEQVGETEDYAYVYTMADVFEKAEIYAIAYDENGLPIETNHIFVEKIDGEYVLVLPDSDGDGLEDCYEMYYGTDIDDVDTDDDWLNDYYEVYCSYTYPTMMDSDENGVLDGDEDYDEDGLTTLEELALGTEPAWNDTDEDGLLDGDEVNVFGTDPLEADIDEDGLVDGDELALGTDPYVPDTDQDGIIDSDERFYQSYTHMVENKDCIIENVTITLEGTGNLKTNTTIESVMNKDVLCTGVVGLIGEPFEIETESQFDSATITFKIDSSKLGETSFDNLMFLWYDEENQRFVELDTVLDGENETVSVTTTHFSKYMIVDRTVWYEAWEKEIDYNPGSSVTTYYTVLAIDCSGSMKSNDPIIYNNNISSAYDSVYNRKKCNRIQGALEYVDGMSAGDKVAVVFFDSSAEVVLDFTDDKEAVKLALQGIYNSGNTSFNAALKTSFSLFDQSVLDDETICTRVVFLSDGESSYDKKYITTAQTNDIIIHGIGLGGSSDDEALADMSVSTGGVFQKADKSEMLSELYEKIYIYDQFDKTDTDGDGLYDIVETAGIRLCNGQIIYTDPNLPDSDGDELDDGVEIDPVPRYSDMKWIKDENVGRSPGLVFWFSSDPWLIDTDDDGIRDDRDNRPMKKGYYSEERREVVVGELTIISSLYNFDIAGHAFLIYESYVDDVLDLSGLTGGYVLFRSNTRYERVDASDYTIYKNEYVTLGNTGKSAEDGGMFQIIDGTDKDEAGIFYNREFVMEITNSNVDEQFYKDNSAYSYEITQKQLNTLIDEHNERNYYNILGNNCTHVAVKAWNKCVVSDIYSVQTMPYFPFYDMPIELKDGIDDLEGSKEVDLKEILRLKSEV